MDYHNPTDEELFLYLFDEKDFKKYNKIVKEMEDTDESLFNNFMKLLKEDKETDTLLKETNKRINKRYARWAKLDKELKKRQEAYFIESKKRGNFAGGGLLARNKT